MKNDHSVPDTGAGDHVAVPTCIHHGHGVAGGEDGRATKKSKELSRQDFLKRGALGGLGLSLAAAVAGYPAARTAATQQQGGNREFDPLPETARGPAIPEGSYLVDEIGRGLYYVTEGVYQMMFMTTGRGVIAVDAPPTIGENIIRAIRDVTDEPITHVVYTHSHADHIGAASLYADEADTSQGIWYYAHEETARLLDREWPNVLELGEVPKPNDTFRNHLPLHVGDRRLMLDYKGPNHSPDNIFVYAPEQRTLMLVDVIYPGWVPFKDLAVSEDIPGWVQAHDQALSYPFETIVGGHLGRLGNRRDVEVQREYILDLRDDALEALNTVDLAPIVQEVGLENPWALFEVYLSTVAKRAAETTLEKWRGRLGAADVFAGDHASIMIESLRID